MLKKPFLAAGLTLMVASSLAARADAPPGRYVINASAGTVYDARTKLTWQRSGDVTTRTQATAISYCASLGTAGLAWRLPKISELLTLVDPTRFDTSIDPTAFPGTQGSQYWSASVSVGTPGNAWFGNFYNGSAGDQDATVPHYVRCVH